jgi:hypothetical protein
LGDGLPWDDEDQAPPKVTGCVPARLFPARRRCCVADGRLEPGGALVPGSGGSAAELAVAALARDLEGTAWLTPTQDHGLFETAAGRGGEGFGGDGFGGGGRYAADSAAALLPGDAVVCGWAQRTLYLTASRLARASGASRYAVLRRALAPEGGGDCVSVPELRRALGRRLNLALSLDALETVAWRFRWRAARGKALMVEIEPLIEFVLRAAPGGGSGDDSGSSSSSSGDHSESGSEDLGEGRGSRWGESKEGGGEREEHSGEGKEGKENHRRPIARRLRRRKAKPRKPPAPFPAQEPEPARPPKSDNGRPVWPLWPPRGAPAIDAAAVVALRVAAVDGGDANGGFSAMHGGCTQKKRERAFLSSGEK